MKKVLILVCLMLFGCVVPEPVINQDPVAQDPEVISGPVDDRSEVAEELLFKEEFSGDLSDWTKTVKPTIISEELSSNDLSIYTTSAFSSKNGLSFSFEVKPVMDPTVFTGFVVKLVEKSFSSNEAKVQVRADGSVSYWISGHCVSTPQVETKSIPVDGEFHTISFVAHSDGRAEWVLDGEVQMERNNFDIGGDLSLVLSGSAGQNPLFLDNIYLVSLNEVASSVDICKAVPHVPAKSSCPAESCRSNGICCPSYAQYYCDGYCYYSRERAMSNSQGRCSEWKIVC